MWRQESHLALPLALTLTLALALALRGILFPEYNHHTSGIKTDQSEQATLSLSLRICQSNFYGPQLAET